jgi:TPR repeat protein
MTASALAEDTIASMEKEIKIDIKNCKNEEAQLQEQLKDPNLTEAQSQAIQQNLVIVQTQESQFETQLAQCQTQEADLQAQQQAQARRQQADPSGLGSVVAGEEKLAESGDLQAQKQMAQFYYDDHNPKKAYYWTRKVAKQGDVVSEYDLGLCFENGTGVDKDLQQAAVWYQKAADQSYVDAENNLGNMYEDGRGVDRDYERAVAFYRKAAASGNAASENNLGRMYYNGKGVEQNRSVAISWYLKAAAQGEQNAIDNLKLAQAQQQQADQQAQQQAQSQVAANDGNQAQSSAAATCPQAVCLARGQAAEQSGDLVAAYHWYMQGLGFDYRNEGTSAPSDVMGNLPQLNEPEESYLFKCLIMLAHAAQKRVSANVQDFRDGDNDRWRHYVVASQAYNAALYIALNRVHYDSSTDTYSGTYNGYGYSQLQAENDQSTAFFHDASQERREQHLAQLQDQENTMNAIAGAAQSAADAIERAPAFQPSVPPAEANAGPQAISVTTSGNQLADRCNNNQTYLRWVTACRNNDQGANQGPCYCAAVTLLNCYINAAPNDPSRPNWEQTRDASLQNAKGVGEDCSKTPSSE